MIDKQRTMELAKFWWKRNYKTVITGVVGTLVGLGCGFVKGSHTADQWWFRQKLTIVEDCSDQP